MEQSIETKC